MHPLALFLLLPPAVLVFHVLKTFLRALWLSSRLPCLKEPPTPLLRRLTVGHNLFGILLSLQREEAADQFIAWRHTLGPIFILRSLFAEPTIIIASAAALKHVAIVRPAIYHKPAVMRNSIADLAGHSGLIFAEGAAHTRLRRIVKPALDNDALLSLAPIFLKHTQSLVSRVHDVLAELGPRQSIDDMFALVHPSTFGLIFDACFGDGVIPPHQYACLQRDYFRCIDEPSSNYLRRYLLQRIFDFVPPQWFAFKRELKRSLYQRIAQSISATSTATKPKPNLIRLVATASEHNSLTDSEVVDLVLTFLVAGQGTSGLAVCWTLYNLATHPHIQERLREELQSNESPTSATAAEILSELDNLPYLHRVVKESLRHDPPVNYSSRVLAADDVVDGVALPKGISIRFPILALQRDKMVWGPDADEFNPDRWLKPEVTQNSLFYCLFWHGARGCLGQRFTMLEVKSFTASMLKRYKLSVPDRQAPPPRSTGPFAVPRDMKLLLEPL